MLINEDILLDKKQTAQLLGEKLIEYKQGNAVVVAVSRKSAITAFHLAEYLQLPFELLPCKEVKHPGKNSETIGSVSADEIILHDTDNIPMDFITHQVQILQHSIQKETDVYHQVAPFVNVKYRPVIIVTDVLQNMDGIEACLNSIRKQHPMKLIVAAAVVASEPARITASQIDQLEFLKMESVAEDISDYQKSFSLPEDDVKLLLTHNREI